MLNVSFQKKDGSTDAGVRFYWKLTIESDLVESILDRFIPELFYDYFYIYQGQVAYLDQQQGVEVPLAAQSLRTIHTRPLTLALCPPLVLLGARLSMQFAESFWEAQLPSNRFLEQTWVADETSSLDDFAGQIKGTVENNSRRKVPKQMLTAAFVESDWLAHYSPRHKRRLYRSVFGVSRKEIDSILGLHAFLGRTCDFSTESPRIIEYIDAEVFYDQPHFNHLFRKMTDLSPLEYLQANSILQDNLMAASYNEIPGRQDTMQL